MFRSHNEPAPASSRKLKMRRKAKGSPGRERNATSGRLFGVACKVLLTLIVSIVILVIARRNDSTKVIEDSMRIFVQFSTEAPAEDKTIVANEVPPDTATANDSPIKAGGKTGQQGSARLKQQAEEIQRQKSELQLQMKELGRKEEKILRAQREDDLERSIHPVHANFTYDTQYQLWEDPALVPGWIPQYFAWHKEQRALLTEQNFREQRYVVMSCPRGRKCGGLTDRLRPILALLQVAHKTSRLFFIKWERPFPLEEFLLPPGGGLDWRMPSFMVDEWHNTQVTGILDMTFFDKQEPMIVSTMYQSWHYGEHSYNERKAEDEPEAMKVFKNVWNAVFTPSPPVAQMIADSFHVLGIHPGHYATAHIRALYAIKKRGEREIRVMVHNALNCLSKLQPGGPYLVAADSSEAIRIAKEYGAYRNVKVVSPPHGKHPLHLGLHNESDTSIVPADFYDIFNDMYLIAETRCMVVGKGGFGRWGILLGHDPDCNTFSSGFKAETCGWKDPPPGLQVDPTHVTSQVRMTIFRKPMD